MKRKLCGFVCLGHFEMRSKVPLFKIQAADCQHIPTLKAENRLLARDLEHTRGELEEIHKKATFYRRQCHFEAKMGLTLLPLRSP